MTCQQGPSGPPFQRQPALRFLTALAMVACACGSPSPLEASPLTPAALADFPRLAITGRSYGGYQTLTMLLGDPGVFRSGVAGAPVTSWRDDDTDDTGRFMGLPMENEAGYDASAPLTHAAQLKHELLLIHGLRDDNVHFQGTARLAKAFIEAGRHFDQLFLPGERHGVRSEAARRYRPETELGFIERATAPRPVAGQP